MDNIVMAEFIGTTVCRTKEQYQYDTGMLLQITGVELPDEYEVHFATSEQSGDAKREINDGDYVTIPDEMFADGATVYAWVVVHDSVTSTETIYKIIIPVVRRARPEQYEPGDTDVLAQAVALLNHKIENIEDADEYAAAAGAFATAAAASAEQAMDSAEQASTSATGASGSAGSAAASATAAESWAKGGTLSRTGEDTNNASYFAGQASDSATEAAASAAAAAEHAYALSVSETTLVFTPPAEQEG